MLSGEVPKRDYVIKLIIWGAQVATKTSLRFPWRTKVKLASAINKGHIVGKQREHRKGS